MGWSDGDIAGQDVANPLAAILSSEMMIRYLGYTKQADLILRAVREAMDANKLTQELDGDLSTSACSDFICEVISAS